MAPYKVSKSQREVELGSVKMAISIEIFVHN